MRKEENLTCTYYIVEEYQSKWDRWVNFLSEHYYLKKYEFGPQTACGDLWQKTGYFGFTRKKDAMRFYKDVTEALKNGTIDEKKHIEDAGITAFRLAKIERTFRRTNLMDSSEVTE